MIERLEDEIKKIDKVFVSKYSVDPRIANIMFNAEQSFSAKKERLCNAKDNQRLINNKKDSYANSLGRNLWEINNKQFDNRNSNLDNEEDTILYVSEVDCKKMNEKRMNNAFKIDLIEENNDNNIYSEKHFTAKKNRNNSSSEKKEMQIKKKFDRNDINIIILKATSLFQKRKLDELENILEYVRRKGVRHSDVDYLLGETKRLKGNFEPARDLLQKAITYQLHSPFAYFSLALSYKSLQKLDKAIHYLKKFLSLKNDNNLRASKELIKCYILKKEDVEAALIASKAIARFDDPELFLIRGKIYENLNLMESAKKDFDEYEKLKRFIKK